MLLVGALLCGIIGMQSVGRLGLAGDTVIGKAASAKKSLKILALGNSFARDTLQYVYDVAKSAGIEDVSVGCLYIGGCSLKKHWTNAKGDKPAYTYYYNKTGKWHGKEAARISDALADEDWDYVMFLQYSGTSGQSDSYGPLEKLLDYVAERTSDTTQMVWDMTWAYQTGYDHKAFENYDNDQSKMYKSIVKAVKSEIVPNKRIEYIFPVGTAIQNARTSYLGDELTRDGRHLHLKYGRYIAALTVVGVLTGYNLSDIGFVPKGTSKKQVKVSIESAKNAIKKPFKVTKSKY